MSEEMRRNFVLILLTLLIYFKTILSSGRILNEINPKVLLISLDGFRYDYIAEAKARNINISAFEKIKNRGIYIESIDNEFPTLTFPSHFSMVTGLHPENHGIVDNIFFDFKLNATFISKNQSGASDSRFYDVGAEPIWVTNQLQGYKSGVAFWIGSEARIKGIRPTHYLAPYNQNFTFNHRVDILMEWFDHKNINLGLMYYHQPDRAGHIYGAGSDEVFKAIEEVNDGLEYLLASINKRPWLKCCLNLIVSSDHGMTNISSDRVIYLHDYIEVNEYIAAPKNSGEIWTLWPTSESTVLSLYTKLKDKHPRLNVFLKNKMPTRLFYDSSSRIGPIVIYADLGWTIIIDRTYGITLKNKGSHGYDPDNKEMSPFFMAAGPQIDGSRTGKLQERIKLIDIYSLICLILDLKPAPNDGSVCRVRPMVRYKSIANINRLPITSVITYVTLIFFISYNNLHC
ncbi:Ectonucleotide pyrophosphatase/phosphodiesterase family member 5 [Schistosoma japonicum]|nr:Ectonucleotide pyrophosphatase/phosphodiesterase family member 5 [Schistosoma japonicum]